LVDYAITVANNLLVIGYSPVNAWGTLVWGTDWWRHNGETLQNVGKAIGFGSTTLSSDVPVKGIEHLNDMGSTLLSDSIAKASTHGYGTSITLESGHDPIYLTGENGYYYVFWGDVTDAEDRVDAEYTATTSYSATYSAVTSYSSAWS